MTERELRLRQFFAGYFNQDWDVTGAKSWPDVAATYVMENPRARVVMLRDDLRAWLEETSPGQGLPAEFGCDYDPLPEGIDERTWVQLLADFLDAQLVN